MPDREKVIKGLKGLECCINPLKAHCLECQYYPCYGQDTTSEKLIADALELLNEQTVSGWVSVKDRLPGQNGDYLVYTCDGIVWPYFFMDGVWEDALGYSTDTVTHWMPLPEPPEVHDAEA